MSVCFLFCFFFLQGKGPAISSRVSGCLCWQESARVLGQAATQNTADKMVALDLRAMDLRKSKIHWTEEAATKCKKYNRFGTPSSEEVKILHCGGDIHNSDPMPDETDIPDMNCSPWKAHSKALQKC